MAAGPQHRCAPPSLAHLWWSATVDSSSSPLLAKGGATEGVLVTNSATGASGANGAGRTGGASGAGIVGG